MVPVTGPVQIAQGFDGALSHARSFAGFRATPSTWCAPRRQSEPIGGPEGGAVEESIWNAPVLAPAAGFVERVRDGIADNPLGRSNFADSSGDYVCIRLDQGGWALLAHLRQGSIAVQPGMRVEIGAPGAVGNSGRSPFSPISTFTSRTDRIPVPPPCPSGLPITGSSSELVGAATGIDRSRGARSGRSRGRGVGRPGSLLDARRTFARIIDLDRGNARHDPAGLSRGRAAPPACKSSIA